MPDVPPTPLRWSNYGSKKQATPQARCQPEACQADASIGISLFISSQTNRSGVRSGRQYMGEPYRGVMPVVAVPSLDLSHATAVHQAASFSLPLLSNCSAVIRSNNTPPVAACQSIIAGTEKNKANDNARHSQGIFRASQPHHSASLTSQTKQQQPPGRTRAASLLARTNLPLIDLTRKPGAERHFPSSAPHTTGLCLVVAEGFVVPSRGS
ncbi:hypothetical protein QBC47DRAFT_390437 [Echria macrotheca]|uniref:Uncharacterized protein n=1 Tax=Echria macrotheca TaxID=438768 RepID=A0AAJ0B707_9PEZI|nr:hypothetical protein QBC47DRAFT_390437 [Echria macrotheca]